MRKHAIWFLLGAISLIALARGAGAAADALYEDDELRIAAIRGVNYLPSYAASPFETWHDYDGKIARRELKLAHELGFNSARVFLSFTAYEGHPSRFLENWEDFLTAAREQGITLAPVLFDGWGVELDPFYQSDFLAASDDPSKRRNEPARTAFDRYFSRPDAYGIKPEIYERRLKFICHKLTPERPIPISKDPAAAYWGAWAPAPPANRMGERDKARYKEYIQAVVEPLKDDPIVVIWDIMNEPDARGMFGKRPDPNPFYEFANWAMRVARELKPMQPMTVGASGGAAGARVFAYKEDVVSLHVFASEHPALGVETREAARHGKPLVVTAMGAMMFPENADEAGAKRQEKLVTESVQQAERARAGYYLWHLIEGDGLTPWAALLDKDGKPRPAMEWLRERWGKK